MFPHGNNKRKNKPYIKTASSVLKAAGEDRKDPALHYKEKITDPTIPPSHEATLKPRNPRQVKNAQAATHKRRHYTQDDLFNLVELAFDLTNYVHRMFLVPELGVVVAHRAILQEFRALMSISREQQQLLSYDTTYNMGDFYISPLLFKHTLFEQAPVMPVAFLIHEKRTQYAHEVLMRFIASEVPEIMGVPGVPLVTDGEENIIKAITNCLPQVAHLRCWNHLQSAARYWLKQRGATTSECSIYTQDLKRLLMSPTQDEYEQLYREVSRKWSHAFVQYYEEKVAPEVMSSAGRWILEPLGVYNGYSGVTTNQSEGFNTLIKNLVQRKKKTVDSLVLALYFLQCYYNNEIQRGLAGLGQYTLLSAFKGLAIHTEDMELVHCFAPENIAEKLAAQRHSTPSNEDGDCTSDNECKEDNERDLENGTVTQELPPSINEQVQPQQAILNQQDMVPGSQIARARLILENNHCTYEAQHKAFMVQGTTHVHAVKLFPKPSCTCPAKGECYHIIAAKLYMGMTVGSKKRTITMTQLRRNVRPKCAKRKGRKGPLADDEIEAAPDAKVRTVVGEEKTPTTEGKMPQTEEKATKSELSRPVAILEETTKLGNGKSYFI